MKNYVEATTGNPFRKFYIYIDRRKPIADQLFIRYGINVKFKKDIVTDDYAFVFCTIPKKQEKLFLECMDQLAINIAICGGQDYSQVCEQFQDAILIENEPSMIALYTRVSQNGKFKDDIMDVFYSLQEAMEAACKEEIVSPAIIATVGYSGFLNGDWESAYILMDKDGKFYAGENHSPDDGKIKLFFDMKSARKKKTDEFHPCMVLWKKKESILKGF